MARTRRLRSKAKTASGDRKKSHADRKPAGRLKSARGPTKPPVRPLDGFIEAAARVLALPIEPQWRAAIEANLEMNLRMAAFVTEFALPDETEPAPVFTA
jgi:hypothetical protein